MIIQKKKKKKKKTLVPLNQLEQGVLEAFCHWQPLFCKNFRKYTSLLTKAMTVWSRKNLRATIRVSANS
jgi:hypothetical protein